jgi:hypothetical protein
MSESFLSEEDLDLRNLTWEELLAWWDLWLLQAQVPARPLCDCGHDSLRVSNDLDEHLYSHGVFRVEPGWKLTPTGVERDVEGAVSESEEAAREGRAPPRS